MFFRKSKKEDKNLISITSEQYCIILAQIILTSGDSYKEFCKNMNKEEDYQDYLIYLQYLLYISQKLLEKKYSIEKVNYFINGAIETIIDSLTFISDEKKGIYVNLMKKQYNLFSNESIDVFSKNGLSRLANLLEEDYNIYHDITPHMNIVLEFTSFIKFHSEDILNEQLKIVD